MNKKKRKLDLKSYKFDTSTYVKLPIKRLKYSARDIDPKDERTFVEFGTLEAEKARAAKLIDNIDKVIRDPFCSTQEGIKFWEMYLKEYKGEPK